MKTFKQALNEGVLDRIFGRPNNRPHYGAFGTESPDFDIERPDAHEQTHEMNYHTLRPADYKTTTDTSGGARHRHVQNMLHGEELPRDTAPPVGRHVTYVPIGHTIGDEEIHLPHIGGNYSGFSNLTDLVHGHLHPSAQAHLEELAKSPIYSNDPNSAPRRVTHVYAFHTNAKTPHPNFSNLSIVNMPPGGSHTSTFNWSPDTHHHDPQFQGKFGLPKNGSKVYYHEVMIHGVEAAPITRRASRRRFKSLQRSTHAPHSRPADVALA